MKKRIVLLAFLFLLGCLTGCGPTAPAEEPAAAPTEAPAPASAPEAEAAEPEAPAPAAEAVILEDFTVECIDGSSFTLSEALEDHELVLINLFFTNCPPCRMEFPFLQEAWEQASDRVAVLALTPDPTDTDEVLTAYAGDLGLTFPIAHEDGTGLYERFVTIGFPTTMLVDRSGRIAMVECGALSSAEDFLALFDGHTGENYDPAVCRYTVCCYGVDNYEEIEGVVVNFCTDTTCAPIVSGETGEAVFTGAPARYHVQIVQVPEGWVLVEGESEWTTEPYGEIYWIGFREAGE